MQRVSNLVGGDGVACMYEGRSLGKSPIHDCSPMNSAPIIFNVISTQVVLHTLSGGEMTGEPESDATAFSRAKCCWRCVFKPCVLGGEWPPTACSYAYTVHEPSAT